MSADPRIEEVSRAIELALVKVWHEDQCACDEATFDGDAVMSGCYTVEAHGLRMSPPATFTTNAVLQAALPILRAQFAEEVITALLTQKIVCPVHRMPDCSPLLNGCSLPNHLLGQVQADAAIARNWGTK